MNMKKYKFVLLFSIITMVASIILGIVLSSCKYDEAKLISLGKIQYDKKNFKKAFTLYQIAIKKGSFVAKNNIGVMFLNGYGVEKNYLKAFKCFQEAALHDVSMANHNLGTMYATGRGIEQDYKKAYEYFKKSADQGVFISQLVISTCYQKVKDNIPKSQGLFWFSDVQD